MLSATFLPASPLLAKKNAVDFDYLIRDAVVFDGKLLGGRRTDVGITGDRIASVGNLKEKTAGTVISGKGLVLAPGFIDAHTHSDFNPFIYPYLSNKVEQGVTTEIVGNCGMSAAPVIGNHAGRIRAIWAREGVAIPEKLPWVSFADYRQSLEKSGLKNNFIGLIGHGNLRSAVMGMSPRPASRSDLEAMKQLLRDAMNQGAYGISYGLVYLPGIFAEREEIIELCREAARKQGICSFHMRSEGGNLIPAIEEVIDVAEKAQAAVQISHLKAAGKNNWEKIHQAFSLIEKARLRGLRVGADAYPYEAGYAELGVMLPDSLYKRQDRSEYFRNPSNRKKILEELRYHDEQKHFHWDRVMLASSSVKRYQAFEGRTLKEIALENQIEPEKFLMDVLIDTDFEVSAFYFSQNPNVMREVIKRSYVAIGSDSIADGTRKPHPRAFATFPKIFHDFVHQAGNLELGDAIRKMTSLPAEHFGIKERGRIIPGYFADLVLFDAGDIKDKATYQEPTRANEGIRWVFVNGRPVFANGKTVPDKPGRYLRN